jgi:hypothetical protein
MKTREWMVGLWLACAALLSACGGGGDEDTAAAQDEPGGVPTRATASVQAFVRFVGALRPADHAEPLSLRGLTPPTSETAEPEDSV